MGKTNNMVTEPSFMKIIYFDDCSGLFGHYKWWKIGLEQGR